MKCPYCDKELEQGEIRSRRAMYFLSNSVDNFGFASKNEKVKISTDNFTEPKLRAYICRACNKIIADFNE